MPVPQKLVHVEARENKKLRKIHRINRTQQDHHLLINLNTYRISENTKDQIVKRANHGLKEVTLKWNKLSKLRMRAQKNRKKLKTKPKYTPNL